MLRKLGIITALTVVFTFGGAFSSAADASAPIDSKQVQYKVFYSINGNLGDMSELNSSDSIKKALDLLQDKWSTKFDLSQLEELVNKAADKKAEQPEKEMKEPVQKEEVPVEKKEEKVEKPQEPKEETKAPAQKVEEPKAEAPQQQQPVKQPEQPKQEQQSNALSQFEIEVVELTNQERAKQGLQPLEVDNELSKVAREKSRDMAVNNYFDHNSPVYGSPFDMMKSYGVDYRTAGENIAKGQRTPEEVVNAWMNSPGHRANILNGNFTHIGVGYVEQGNHWTQQFIGK